MSKEETSIHDLLTVKNHNSVLAWSGVVSQDFPAVSKRGGEIVKMMGTSAYYAPASGSVQMAEAIIKDKKRILPCAAYCDGEFGINGLFVGVPTVLGKNGVERIVEIELNAEEQLLMDESASHVADLVETVKTTFPELA